MNSLRVKHLSFYLAWLACMIYYLVFNFSLIALGILLLLAGLGLYKTCFSQKESTSLGIQFIPLFLSSGLLLAICSSVIKVYLESPISIADIKTSLIDSVKLIPELFSNLNIFIFGYLLLSFMLLVNTGKFHQSYFWATICRYLLATGIFAYVFYILTDSLHFVAVYIAISLIYCVIDAILKMCLGTIQKNVIRYYFGLSIVLLLVLISDKPLLTFVGSSDFLPIIPVFERFPWYNAVFACFVTGIVFIISLICSQKDKGEDGETENASENKITSYDALITMVMLSAIPIFFAANVCNIYFKEIIILIYCLVSVLSLFSRKNNIDYNNVNGVSALISIPVKAAAFVFYIIEEQHGKGIFAIVFLVGAYLTYMLVKKNMSDNFDNPNLRGVYAIILFWILSSAVCHMILTNRSLNRIGIVLAVFISLLIIVTLSLRNPHIYMHNKLLSCLLPSIPVIMLIVCIIAQNVSNVPIKAKRTDSLIEIKIDSQDYNEAKYCWINEIDDYKTSIIHPEQIYVPLSSNNIQCENGLLKIAVLDAEGTYHYYSHWFES